MSQEGRVIEKVYDDGGMRQKPLYWGGLKSIAL